MRILLLVDGNSACLSTFIFNLQLHVRPENEFICKSVERLIRRRSCVLIKLYTIRVDQGSYCTLPPAQNENYTNRNSGAGYIVAPPRNLYAVCVIFHFVFRYMWPNIPAHKGVEGNEVADTYAKGAAKSHYDPVAHLARKTAKARTQRTREWVRGHIKGGRRNRPRGVTVAGSAKAYEGRGWG